MSANKKSTPYLLGVVARALALFFLADVLWLVFARKTSTRLTDRGLDLIDRNRR